jgi:hypothetical protein
MEPREFLKDAWPAEILRSFRFGIRFICYSERTEHKIAFGWIGSTTAFGAVVRKP